MQGLSAIENQPVLTLGRQEVHANVVEIDKEQSVKPEILTVRDLLTDFPSSIRKKYKAINRFADQALALSYFIPVVGGEGRYEQPSFGEGRSTKVLVNVPSEENHGAQILLEFKGSGALTLLGSRVDSDKLSHGFPVKENPQGLFYGNSLSVKGVENKMMGQIALVNGLSIVLHYLHENNIPLTKGLEIGGVTVPLAFRVSPDITDWIHSLPGYINNKREDDKAGILVVAASAIERQPRTSAATAEAMETRARAVRFLLENKIFYDRESSHPQQFGDNEEALLSLFDFGDMVFAADIPAKVHLPFERKKKKEYTRTEIWKYLTYKAMNRQLMRPNRDEDNVHDGIFPTYSIPGKYEEQNIIEWEENIRAFFHTLLERKLHEEQVNRLIELYPYCPSEVTLFVTKLFAETKDSAITKSIIRTRNRILRRPELRYIKDKYDMTGVSELSVENVDTFLEKMNSPLNLQVENYILSGQTAKEPNPGGDIIFEGLINLIKRVNATMLPRRDVSKQSVYTLTKKIMGIYTWDIAGMQVFNQMKTIKFENYPDEWVLKYVRLIVLGA